MDTETIRRKFGKREVGVALLVLACIYMVSPSDVISEGSGGNGIWSYADDMLVFILACLKSYGMGKGGI